ncbi:MAG: DVUA0089 family protein [Pseudomonadota bacterium]
MFRILLVTLILAMPVTQVLASSKGAGTFQVNLNFQFDDFVPPTPNEFIIEGNLTQDDEVVLAELTLDIASTFRFQSFAYGGGTLPNGTSTLPGGFDTVLSLFSDGLLLMENDDSDFAETDPNTGAAYDAGFDIFLQPGTYTLAITQYDNFPGAQLSDFFTREGSGNFTPGLVNEGAAPGDTMCLAPAFCDVSGTGGANERTPDYVVAVSPIPLPGAFLLMVSTLFSFPVVRWWR